MLRTALTLAAGLAWFLLLAAPAPAQAAWLRAETPRFIVYGDGSEGDLRAYAAKLEDFDALLRFYHGMDEGERPERKLPIYLLEHKAQLRQLNPKLGDNAAGFYLAGTGDVYGVALADAGAEGENDQVLFHEYVHHFVNQYFPAAYPGWLQEGYAEYLMTARLSASRFEVGRFNRGRTRALGKGASVSWEDLLTRRASELAGGQMRLDYYAQAWLLTHFMVSDPGRKAELMAYLRALNAGAEPLAAWTTATGEDLAMLERRLDAYRAQPFRVALYSRPGAEPVSVTIQALPASTDDLLLLDQRVRARNVPKDERVAVAAQVRAAAARHPGDRFARLALARAEVTFGDLAAGEAVLQPMLQADPDDVDALRLLGLARLRAGQEDKTRREALHAEAGRYFGRAHKLSPGHYQTLYGFARSRMADPDYPSENTLNVLRLAVQIAPQVDEMRLTAGQAMIRKGLPGEAAAMLSPVANNPHGGGNAALARRLLDAIKAGAAPGDGDKDRAGG